VSMLQLHVLTVPDLLSPAGSILKRARRSAWYGLVMICGNIHWPAPDDRVLLVVDRA
jgi:hypothetical protein